MWTHLILCSVLRLEAFNRLTENVSQVLSKDANDYLGCGIMTVFVCFCLFVTKITQKLPDGFQQNVCMIVKFIFFWFWAAHLMLCAMTRVIVKALLLTVAALSGVSCVI